MDAYGVPVASQLEVIRLIGGVKAGSALSGHAMARLMGQSHAEARAHPATAPLRAISEYLGADGPLSDDFKAAYDDMVAAIRRRPRP
jgi:hypothetical protein